MFLSLLRRGQQKWKGINVLQLGNPFQKAKAICTVYPKNEGAKFLIRSYARTARGWNGLVTKKSHALGEESTCQRELVPDPLLPQSPRLMLEPPYRAFHTCGEPFFCLRMPFWVSLLAGSHTTSWKTAGNQANLETLKRKLETPFPHYIQHHEPLGRP